MSVYALTWIAYIVSATIYIAILYNYFDAAFEMRYSAKVTIAIYALLVAADTFVMTLENAQINILTSVVIYTLLVRLYIGNLKTRIVMAVFIYLAAFVSDFIAAYTIVIVGSIAIENIVFGVPEFIYGLLISRVLLTIFAKILFNVTTRRKLPKLTTAQWVALIVPPTSSIFVLYNFLYLRGHSTADIISSMMVVVTNFIVITVYDKILTDVEVDTRNAVLEEQIKHYSYQSFLAEKSEKLILKTKHDISNLLIGVKADIQMNRPENVEKRISELLGEISAFDGPARSGNLAIDSIINFKSNAARSRQIYFAFELKIPENLTLDSIILCQILGNALDNAVEATENVEDASKRMVQIYMSYLHETLFLQIVNPFEGEIKTDNRGRMLSSKRGFRSEGIGLQSIRNAIADWQGDVEVDYSNGEFSLSITLYNVGCSQETSG